MMVTQIAKKTVDLNKIIFESSYATMVTLQEYAEKTLGEHGGKMTWASEEGKKSIGEVYDVMKQCRDSFKDLVDEGFERLEEIVHFSPVPVASQDRPPVKSLTAPEKTTATM